MRQKSYHLLWSQVFISSICEVILWYPSHSTLESTPCARIFTIWIAARMELGNLLSWGILLKDLHSNLWNFFHASAWQVWKIGCQRNACQNINVLQSKKPSAYSVAKLEDFTSTACFHLRSVCIAPCLIRGSRGRCPWKAIWAAITAPGSIKNSNQLFLNGEDLFSSSNVFFGKQPPTWNRWSFHTRMFYLHCAWLASQASISSVGEGIGAALSSSISGCIGIYYYFRFLGRSWGYLVRLRQKEWGAGGEVILRTNFLHCETILSPTKLFSFKFQQFG